MPLNATPACAAPLGAVRLVVELTHDDAGVQGQVIPVAGGDPLPFSSWLDLLRILESATAASPSDPREVAR